MIVDESVLRTVEKQENLHNASIYDIVDKPVNISLYFKPAILFLSALYKKKKSSLDAEILNIFKELKINIPLLEAIKQSPKCEIF